jgi:hypothetical protein
MKANLILEGFFEITRTDLLTDQPMVSFIMNYETSKDTIIIRWVMMQRHKILGLGQFFVWAAPRGYHQTYIG